MTTIRNIQPGEQVFIMNLILPQTKMCTSTIFKSSLSKLCRQKKRETEHTLYLLVYHSILALSIHKYLRKWALMM